jgi:hypothetical protein
VIWVRLVQAAVRAACGLRVEHPAALKRRNLGPPIAVWLLARVTERVNVAAYRYEGEPDSEETSDDLDCAERSVDPNIRPVQAIPFGKERHVMA